MFNAEGNENKYLRIKQLQQFYNGKAVNIESAPWLEKVNYIHLNFNQNAATKNDKFSLSHWLSKILPLFCSRRLGYPTKPSFLLSNCINMCSNLWWSWQNFFVSGKKYLIGDLSNLNFTLSLAWKKIVVFFLFYNPHHSSRYHESTIWITTYLTAYHHSFKTYATSHRYGSFSYKFVLGGINLSVINWQTNSGKTIFEWDFQGMISELGLNQFKNALTHMKGNCFHLPFGTVDSIPLSIQKK